MWQVLPLTVAVNTPTHNPFYKPQPLQTSHLSPCTPGLFTSVGLSKSYYCCLECPCLPGELLLALQNPSQTQKPLYFFEPKYHLYLCQEAFSDSFPSYPSSPIPPFTHTHTNTRQFFCFPLHSLAVKSQEEQASERVGSLSYTSLCQDLCWVLGIQWWKIHNPFKA